MPSVENSPSHLCYLYYHICPSFFQAQLPYLSMTSTISWFFFHMKVLILNFFFFWETRVSGSLTLLIPRLLPPPDPTTFGKHDKLFVFFNLETMINSLDLVLVSPLQWLLILIFSHEVYYLVHFKFQIYNIVFWILKYNTVRCYQMIRSGLCMINMVKLELRARWGGDLQPIR